jgi:hypothetical protein
MMIAFFSELIFRAASNFSESGIDKAPAVVPGGQNTTTSAT